MSDTHLNQHLGKYQIPDIKGLGSGSDTVCVVRTTYLGMFCHQARPRRTPSLLESPLQHHTDARQCRRSATDKQEIMSLRQRTDQTHQSVVCVCVCVCVSRTLIPVLVASLTASSSLSYFGLNVTVKAQSMIRPANRQQAEHLLVFVLQAGFCFVVVASFQTSSSRISVKQMENCFLPHFKTKK